MPIRLFSTGIVETRGFFNMVAPGSVLPSICSNGVFILPMDAWRNVSPIGANPTTSGANNPNMVYINVEYPVKPKIG